MSFYMPAEFEKQQAAVLIFPELPGSWGRSVRAASAFAEIINTIAKHERVYVAVNEKSRANAEKLLDRENITLLDIPSDDAWARDVAPTFVRDRESGEVRGISWKFYAWGGEYDGLYADWAKDDALAEEFCRQHGQDARISNHIALCIEEMAGNVIR